MELMLILQLCMGICWIITYMLIIIRGFKDKTYGMPIVALCANISWEFIFSFIYPHEQPQLIIDIIWFLLDVVIMIQYLVFGRKDFKRYIPKKYFYPTFLLTLTTSFLIIISISFEFNDFLGQYAAFSQNLMMSILFISLLIKRGNLDGQSIYIAVFKMVGSLSAGIGFYIYFESILANVLCIATLVFDLIYIGLVYKVQREKKIRL